MNEYDSNRIYDSLKKIGYKKTENYEDANCYLLNTCHIRDKAKEKVYHEIGRVKKIFRSKKKPLVIIAGCVAQAENQEMLKREPYIDLVIGPQAYHKINDTILNHIKKKIKIEETEFDAISKFKYFNKIKNNSGKSFTEVTDKVYTADQRGWWNDIEKGDFDNDGDMDLILGNLGLNYKYQASEEKPFRVYLNDFDENATYDIVLSYKSDDTEYPVRGRQCSSQQMPAIKDKFKNYNTFASASLEEIYSDKMLEESLKYEITSFQSVYLENKDGIFSAKPLPYQAQFSNINSIVVKDVDSDGNLDAILGGNLYNAEVETPRNDASFGLWLKGDGKGGFDTQLPRESGLVMRGDVRNMKTIQVGEQTHLLVAKNDEALQQIRIN